MIYFKNLQTEKIIEFSNIQEIGAIFYDTTLYATPTQSEIDTHLFDKKKQELITYCNEQRKLRKNTFKVIFNNQEYIVKDIDECIRTINELIIQEPRYPFPKPLLNNANASIVFMFQSLQQAQYVYNELLDSKVPNYNQNYFDNTLLINACTTLDELENLQLTFIDLVINL